MQARESTLALKPRTDVTRGPKQGYQWPHKKDLCPRKIKKKDLTHVRSETQKIILCGMRNPNPKPSPLTQMRSDWTLKNLEKRFNPHKMSLLKMRCERANLILPDKTAMKLPVFLHLMFISFLYFVGATSGNIIRFVMWNEFMQDMI